MSWKAGAGTMSDKLHPDDRELSRLPWADWMEQNLREMMGHNVKSAALVMFDDDGGYMCSYHNCDPCDLYAISGVLQSEGMWMELRNNGPHLREIIENEED